jgi:hypothetical protein
LLEDEICGRDGGYPRVYSKIARVADGGLKGHDGVFARRGDKRKIYIRIFGLSMRNDPFLKSPLIEMRSSVERSNNLAAVCSCYPRYIANI